MNYTVEEINNGIAKIAWSDGSWSFVEMTSDMTEADLDDAVYRAIPPSLKIGSVPAFVSEGATRTAAEKPLEPEIDDRPAWLIARQDAYGSTEAQIEYITENGLDAWQTRVAEIKAANPKPAE